MSSRRLILRVAVARYQDFEEPSPVYVLDQRHSMSVLAQHAQNRSHRQY